MKAQDFEIVLEETLERTRQVLGTKADEYAIEGDRLHNFKQAAQLQRTTPVKALGGMMAKHTISIYDMIETGAGCPIEMWDEKIGDHINYLILLRAVVLEQLPDSETRRYIDAFKPKA